MKVDSNEIKKSKLVALQMVDMCERMGLSNAGMVMAARVFRNCMMEAAVKHMGKEQGSRMMGELEKAVDADMFKNKVPDEHFSD